MEEAYATAVVLLVLVLGILFATSGGSRFGNTVQELKISVPKSCEIVEGKLLNGIQTIPGIRKWTETLDL